MLNYSVKGLPYFRHFTVLALKYPWRYFFSHRLVKATADCETAQFQPSDCDVLPGKLVDFRKERNVIREMNYLLGTQLFLLLQKTTYQQNVQIIKNW